MRLSDRTHAGRVGEQLLTARAFPTLAHMLCAAPVFAPHGGDPQLCWLRNVLSNDKHYLVALPQRLGLDDRPKNWGSPPFGAGRAGRCPHHSPVLGHLKNVGVFLNGGSPSYGAGAVGGTLARSLRGLDFRGVLIFRLFRHGRLLENSCSSVS